MNLPPPPPALRPIVDIRWMSERHWPAILAIESASMASLAWDEPALLSHLRERNVIGMTVESIEDERIVLGHMVYRLERDEIRVLRFAVDPAYRHGGVATAMLAKLRAKLSQGRRERIVFMVPEVCGAMHRFLRAMGVRAIGVERGAFGAVDGFVFVDRLSEATT